MRNDPPRAFIPQPVRTGWQLYGLSLRHLLRLLLLPVPMAAGIWFTLLLWPVVPERRMVALVLRSLYTLIPVFFAVAWLGLAVLPIEHGRTYSDLLLAARRHRRQRNVYPLRRQQP